MGRKMSIIASIIGIFIVFMAEIPINPIQNLYLKFYLFQVENLEYYPWGYVLNGQLGQNYLTSYFPENIMPIILLCLLILSILSCVFTSFKNSNLKNSITLMEINLGSLIIISIFYLFQFISILNFKMEFIFLGLGLGFYLLVFYTFLIFFILRDLKKS